MSKEEIIQEIYKLEKIEFNEEDLLGKGKNYVYSYLIKNQPMAVKIIQTQEEAEEEK